MAPAENHLIALLPRRVRESLLAACESTELSLGVVLCRPGETTRHVYFPRDCVAARHGRDSHPAAFDVYGKGGRLISSRAVDRTVSFVFPAHARLCRRHCLDSRLRAHRLGRRCADCTRMARTSFPSTVVRALVPEHRREQAD
jgi:hypothetical protein